MTKPAAAIERVRPDPRPPIAAAAALQEACAAPAASAHSALRPWAFNMPALRGERRPADAATIDGAELRTRIAVRRAELQERYECFEQSAFDVD